jgi:hypothetical protein
MRPLLFLASEEEEFDFSEIRRRRMRQQLFKIDGKAFQNLYFGAVFLGI